MYFVLNCSISVFAQNYYDGRSGHPVSLVTVLDTVQPGQVLILSELHDNLAHHNNQAEILKSIIRKGQIFSVGMELFNYTDQNTIDAYINDEISEKDFLQKIVWGKLDFSFYRFQVRIPSYLGGKTVGINIPRFITGKISKSGFNSLTESELRLLPPNFELGQDSYFQRFKKVMEDHVPENKILDYFTSHSLWDDTMAWQAAEFVRQHPDQIFVILVGDFHVAYQDGLIARLKSRGVTNITSISQVDSTGLNLEEKNLLIMPDPVYGVRADFVYDVR